MITTAGLYAERLARQKAPRDTGRLARSIVSKVSSPNAPVSKMQATVASPLGYAAVMEEGPPARPPPAAR